MTFLKAANWRGIAVGLGLVALLAVGSWTIVREAKKIRDRLNAPEQPLLIEWEVDKDYGEKRTTLPNGLKLFVYKVEQTGPDTSTSTDTRTTWGWSVGSEGLTEREAMNRALHMGGVQ